METDDALYDPEKGPLHWPICSECKAPYVLRLGISLSADSGWWWFADCKHKAAEPEMAHATPPS